MAFRRFFLLIHWFLFLLKQLVRATLQIVGSHESSA